MQTLKKNFRRLIVATVLALVFAGSQIESRAGHLYVFLFTADNGSFGVLSCGSSAGNYRAVYDAPDNTWTYFDAYPGDCDDGE